jgi:hypothetical protein
MPLAERVNVTFFDILKKMRPLVAPLSAFAAGRLWSVKVAYGHPPPGGPSQELTENPNGVLTTTPAKRDTRGPAAGASAS